MVSIPQQKNKKNFRGKKRVREREKKDTQNIVIYSNVFQISLTIPHVKNWFDIESHTYIQIVTNTHTKNPKVLMNQYLMLIEVMHYDIFSSIIC